MKLNLTLPRSYRPKRSETIRPERFRGYARCVKCNGEAFWFKRFAKAFFDLSASDIWFEDGQICFPRQIQKNHCPHCRANLNPGSFKVVKIIQEDEADAIHAQSHADTPYGQICPICKKEARPL